MKKETKIKIINAALWCSMLSGGVALQYAADYYYSHMPLSGVITDEEGNILKERINYQDGSYEERIPARTYINQNGETEYYAPDGYTLTTDESGKYICVKLYKDNVKTR